MISSHKACHCCGLIHRLPPLEGQQSAVCVRCNSTIHVVDQHRSSSSRTAAAALAALMLYLPAMLLPILRVEQLGHREDSSVLAGTIELLTTGNWFVGTIVLLFSIVFPLLKILLLLELSWLGFFRREHRATTYRIMEHAGKWSMMDVMLLAFMVMLIKLGDLVEFRFGPGVVAFVLCVAMSMLASISFDPHAIWENTEEPVSATGGKGS